MAVCVLTGKKVRGAYQKWLEGYTHKEIAAALCVSRTSLVRQIAKYRELQGYYAKSDEKPPLVYGEE